MKISRESIKGKRVSNQDYTQIAKNKKAYNIVALCDGMGGHQAGDQASRLVAESLTSKWAETNIADKAEIIEWLKLTINEINSLVYEKGLADNDLFGMGTTLVSAVILEDEIIIANVGDSRAYSYTDKQVRLITEDHSFAYELYLKGEITKEEADTHCQRNMLTRSIGLPSEVSVDIFELTKENHQLIILCSDGLSDTLSNEEMAGIIATSGTLEASSNMLVEQAYRNGSTDNITVMLVDPSGNGEEGDGSDRRESE